MLSSKILSAFCLVGSLALTSGASAKGPDSLRGDLVFLNNVVTAILKEKGLQSYQPSVKTPSIFTSPYQLLGVGVHGVAMALNAAGVPMNLKHKPLMPREVNYTFHDGEDRIWIASCSLTIDTTLTSPHRRFFVFSHSCSPVNIAAKLTPGFEALRANFAAVVTVDDVGTPLNVQLVDQPDGKNISELLR